MKIKISILIVLVIAMGHSSMAREITFDDLYGLPGFDDVQISPDGESIIFTLNTNNFDESKRASHLWIMNSDGSNIKQLTAGPGDEWAGQWLPDGKSILFLADRDESNQIWSLALDGGEPRQLTDISTEVSEFLCAPNGKLIVYRTRVFPECKTDSCNQARLDENENSPIVARLYDHLLFRHYNSWDDGRVNRLFVLNLEDQGIEILNNVDQNIPTAYLGGKRDFDIAPESDDICYVMNVSQPDWTAVWPNNDLFTVSPFSNLVNIITKAPGLETTPRYSPNGKYLAYISQERAGYESDQRDLIICDWPDQHTNMTQAFDRSIGQYVWDPDSKHIYFTAIEHGLSKVWRVNTEKGEIELLLGDAVYDDLCVSPDGEFLVLSRSLSDQPYELYRYDIKSQKLTRLTKFSKAIVSELDLTQAEDFWFEGFNGDSVHGYLTLPPNFDADKKYPLALLIHGGPQWCWLGDFNYYGWNTQLVAAQGYVVAQIDPHGSVGYGLEFKEYVSGNWGRGDYEDLMLGVDYLLAHHPFIDSTRMAALGRSYGGFMVNWICGHTDRFKCLISIDGTYNHIASYGSTEELWFPEWEFKGTPWTNSFEYVRSSPASYVGNFKTPTMVIHGQKDYRVDLSEGLSMFTALQRMYVPSQLLYFPDEGHNVGKLKNLRYVYEKQLEWLELWLKE
jgi:dipeptidyl aminopeptidase/acylaminoacyl peptidase